MGARARARPHRQGAAIMKLAHYVGILLLSLNAIACHPPVSIITPAGRTAFSADVIAVRVNELEAAAIQANSEGALSLDVTRTIVRFTVVADRILAQTPDGWRVAVITAWIETKRQLLTPRQLNLNAYAPPIIGIPLTNTVVLGVMDILDATLGVQ